MFKLNTEEVDQPVNNGRNSNSTPTNREIPQNNPLFENTSKAIEFCLMKKRKGPVSLLEKKFPKPNPFTHDEMQLLLKKAIKEGDYEATLFLLKNGADLNVTEHFSPLIYACTVYPWNDTRAIDLIFNSHPDITQLPRSTNLGLVYDSYIERLIQLGVDLNPKGCIPPIIYAILSHRMMTAAKLMELTNDFTCGFINAIKTQELTFQGLEINEQIRNIFTKTFSNASPVDIIEILNLLISQFPGDWIQLILEMQESNDWCSGVAFDPSTRHFQLSEVSDNEFMYALGQENLITLEAYAIKKGMVYLRDGRSPIEHEDFNFNRVALDFLFSHGIELNPTNREPPLMVATRPGVHAEMFKAPYLLKIGADPRIEWQRRSVLQQLYRCVVTFGYGVENVLKLISKIRKILKRLSQEHETKDSKIN